MNDENNFKLTEREAGLLERIAEATKMECWFYIDEDCRCHDLEGEMPGATDAELVSMLEDGLAYALEEEQSGGFSPEEAKEVEAVFKRARIARCEWQGFGALVHVKNSDRVLPTYRLTGMFEEGVYLPKSYAPDLWVAMTVAPDAQEPSFPSYLDPYTRKADDDDFRDGFMGVVWMKRKDLDPDILKAIDAGKRLIVEYERDESRTGGVGPDLDRFPIWRTRKYRSA